MNSEIRKAIKKVLKDNLLGDKNKDKREKIIKTLNISDSTIKTWTSDNQPGIPTADDIPAICDILGITINQLFGGIENEMLVEALKLYDAYRSHPDRQESVKVLLELK